MTTLSHEQIIDSQSTLVSCDDSALQHHVAEMDSSNELNNVICEHETNLHVLRDIDQVAVSVQ
jgi:hypothetical protein